jgi:hypothetical protein
MDGDVDNDLRRTAEESEYVKLEKSSNVTADDLLVTEGCVEVWIIYFCRRKNSIVYAVG